MKGTQESVKVELYGQIDKIIFRGCYCIGEMRDVAMNSIHDVIRLSLNLKSLSGKKLLKTSYTLDELRDLETKIVLITGSRAENTAAVDQFLDVGFCVVCVCLCTCVHALVCLCIICMCVYVLQNVCENISTTLFLFVTHTHTLPSLSQTLHCVCRIAEVLIKLQQAGHVQYIGWRMEFYCQSLLVEDLRDQAKQMEDELQRWNREVVDARRRFYELNYYTTRQLLVLRSELGVMKSEQAPQLHPRAQVMALLESISSAIPPCALAGVVQKAASDLTQDLLRVIEHSPVLTSTLVEREVPLEMPALPPVSQLASDTQPMARVALSLPPVRLSQEDLSEKQMSLFTDICESMGYCEMTALKAIEEVGDGDWNDIVNWLKCKVEREFSGLAGGDVEFEQEDSDIEDAQSADDLPPSEGDNTQSKINRSDKYCYNVQSAGLLASQSPGVGHSISTQPQTGVVVTHRQHIDETNEEVQALLDAEVGTVEECIRAIEMYETANIAIHHMDEPEEEGEREDLFPWRSLPAALSDVDQSIIEYVVL